MKKWPAYIGIIFVGFLGSCGSNSLDEGLIDAQENSFLTYRLDSKARNIRKDSNKIDQNYKDIELMLAACESNAELCSEIPATRHNHWRYIEGTGYRKFSSIGAENLDFNNLKKWITRDYYRYHGYGSKHGYGGYGGHGRDYGNIPGYGYSSGHGYRSKKGYGYGGIKGRYLPW